MATRPCLVLVLCVGCSSEAASPDPALDAAVDTATTADAPDTAVDSGMFDTAVPDGADSGLDAPVDAPPPLLSAKYPGDLGIDKDPAVLWVEDFEEGSVAAVRGRYEDSKNAAGMALVADVPAKSLGKASMRFTAGGGGPSATDLYKKLPNQTELFVRYYVKYQKGIQWHHTGLWIGGYDPPTSWPNPQAGLRPNGDDRFAIAFEPVGATGAADPRLDFYAYWMTMHSWKDVPTGSDAYYGNTVVHRASLRAKDDAWSCVEMHVKVNPDPASKAGAQLGLWVDDVSIAQFDDAAPLGYWVKDKFCSTTADAPSCTSYPPPAGTTMVPLDLQLRKTATLQLNHFWPQNYVTAGPAGNVYFDHMVVARTRVGCLR
ncbi:MAG: hypothetical protein IPJ34_33555 [Myxococcales bacterium]|nr:hypothetical protein [Myxococcales bacterium]